MNKLIAASILTLAVAYPALAESPTAWPRDHDITVQHRPVYVAPKAKPAALVNAWKADSATYDQWKALPATFDNSVLTNADPKELDKQRIAHRAYWVKRNAELIDRNGDLAPVLPVRVHERLNAKAFGSPVMGGDN